LERSVEEVKASNPRLGLSSKEAAYAVILLAAVSLFFGCSIS
jgi:hypothetical protein